MNSQSVSSPIFFIHQSPTKRKRLPYCLSYIKNKYGKSIKTGVIVRISSIPQNKLNAFSDTYTNAADFMIVDPELYLHNDDLGSNSKTLEKKYSFFSKPLPDKTDDKWIEKIIKTQRDAGANVILSPSRFLDPSSNSKKKLKQQLEWAKASEQFTKGDEKLLINLTLNHTWISDNYLRNELLNELIDTNCDNFYIRVLWPPLTPRYSQLKNSQILYGYKELANALSQDDRNLILPTTSLTGWISVAFGATGFSMGPSHDQQCFAQKLIIRRQKGAASVPAKNRYFERNILHIVDLESRDALSNGDGYLFM